MTQIKQIAQIARIAKIITRRMAVILLIFVSSSSSSSLHLRTAFAFSSLPSFNEGATGYETTSAISYGGDIRSHNDFASSIFQRITSQSSPPSKPSSTVTHGNRNARRRELSPTMATLPSAEISSEGRSLLRVPYLAIVTEPDACDDDRRMEETFRTIQRAVLVSQNTNGDGDDATGVDLISIRVSNPNNGHGDGSFQKRVVELTTRVLSLRNERTKSIQMMTHDDEGDSNGNRDDDRRRSFHVVVNDNVET